MMKDKIYFYMTNLYGWLVIILVGVCLIPTYTSDLLKGYLVISATKVLLILSFFVWLYFRIVFQLKRDASKYNYLFLFIIDAVYITMVIMNISITFSALLFFIFLDPFVYLMKNRHIKNAFRYITSMLFIIIIDLIISFFIITFCFGFVGLFIDVFNAIL